MAIIGLKTPVMPFTRFTQNKLWHERHITLGFEHVNYEARIFFDICDDCQEIRIHLQNP